MELPALTKQLQELQNGIKDNPNGPNNTMIALNAAFVSNQIHLKYLELSNSQDSMYIKMHDFTVNKMKEIKKYLSNLVNNAGYPITIHEKVRNGDPQFILQFEKKNIFLDPYYPR